MSINLENLQQTLQAHFINYYIKVELSSMLESSIVIAIYNSKHSLIGALTICVEDTIDENTIAKSMVKAIDDFINNVNANKYNSDYVIYDIGESSENYILNNFYPCSITYKGNTYTNLQSAYEAQKEPNPISRLPYTVCDGYTAIKMSKPGVKPNSKLMYKLLKIKFNKDKCKKHLLATNDKEIIYQNNWHDNYWGVCTCDKCVGQGQNELGKLLMILRAELNEKTY